jgi:hypothetical protein
MKRRYSRKCLYCKEEFEVDVRNANKQKCCRKRECRGLQKAARDARWRAKNPDYFKGPENVARVQAWRVANPGYSQRRVSKGKGQDRGGKRRSAADALQDALTLQAIDPEKEFGVLASSALQDALGMQDLVLIGLIAHLTDTTLQVDIAATAQRLLQLGQDILSGTHPDAPEESAAPGPASPRPGAVQLD